MFIVFIGDACVIDVPFFLLCFACVRYELWKPYLRAKMEDDMKAVSLGTKMKNEILASGLQEMKACFLDVCYLQPLNSKIICYRFRSYFLHPALFTE